VEKGGLSGTASVVQVAQPQHDGTFRMLQAILSSDAEPRPSLASGSHARQPESFLFAQAPHGLKVSGNLTKVLAMHVRHEQGIDRVVFLESKEPSRRRREVTDEPVLVQQDERHMRRRQGSEALPRGGITRKLKHAGNYVLLRGDHGNALKMVIAIFVDV